MDGYEVLAQIQRHAAGSFLPVVVVAADNSTASVTDVLSLGAHDFLSTPLKLHALRKALALPSTGGNFLTVNVSPATLVAGLPRLLGDDVPWHQVVSN